MTFDLNAMYNGAKLPTNSMTTIRSGNHVLALARIYQSSKANEAVKFRADFYVLKSETHTPGDIVSNVFQPQATYYPGAGADEAGRLVDLVNKLFNRTFESAEGSATLTKLMDQAQPGRGIVVNCSGFLVTDKDGSPKLNKKGSQIVNVDFAGVEDQSERQKIKVVIDALPRFQPQEKVTPVAQPVTVATPVATTNGLPF